MVAFGDFNAKSNSWTDIEGLKIDIFTSSFGFHKSYIEQLTLHGLNIYVVTESGVHSSFHANCHHQVTYVKFNLMILKQKNCVLLNSLQKWLLGCFWPFSYVYAIN